MAKAGEKIMFYGTGRRKNAIARVLSLIHI